MSSDGLTNSFDESLAIASIKKITCPFTSNSYDFIYDNANQLKEYKMRNGETILLSINKINSLSSKYTIGGIEYITTKEYNKNPLQNRIIKTKNGNASDSDYSKFTYSYEYHPVLGTITKKTGGNSLREISYENLDDTNYYSSNPQQITQKYGNNTFDIIYRYNQSNDIIKTTGFGSCSFITSSYSYDKNHRIAKEGHLTLNMDYSYEYNKYNRLSKVYRNKTLFKDFSYDTLGRLTNIKGYGTNSLSFQYEGNSLYPSKMNGNSCKFNRNGLLYMYGSSTYEYDYSGLRYSKRTSNGTYVKYYYVGDKLLGEDYSNNVKIRYMYDQEGIAGARYYNGNQVTEYEYVKDGYNNVIAIVKGDTVVAKYFYDCWGNILKEDMCISKDDPFAKINPIRYRSYYYDIETKLYYLQTRYYNPEIGAFISPDNIEYLDAENIGGLNLYTYCANNPIKYYDSTGHSPLLIIFGIVATVLVGGAIAGAFGALDAHINGTDPLLDS